MKNGKIKIESGVPIPDGSGRKGSGPIQTAMRAMKKGQSIMLPATTASNLYTQARDYIGKGKFAIRKVEGGYRVWRTK